MVKNVDYLILQDAVEIENQRRDLQKRRRYSWWRGTMRTIVGLCFCVLLLSPWSDIRGRTLRSSNGPKEGTEVTSKKAFSWSQVSFLIILET